MIRIPKCNLRAKVLVALSLWVCSTNALAGGGLFDDEQKKLILKTTMYYINQKHIQPPVLNDEFSSKAWQKYFDYIDGSHKIFLAEDIESLQKYKTTLDEAIKDNSVDFFEAAELLYNKRMVALQAICDDILTKPFTFSKQEVLKEETSFPSSLQEQGERWRKSLKLSVLKKYQSLKEKNKGKKDAALEAESRMAVRKWMAAFFARMTKPKASDVNFSYFINAILFQVDPHTIYNIPAQTQLKQENISKRFFGIGISMKETDGEYFVETLAPGGEASNTGLLQVGDHILRIENGQGELQDIFAMPADDVVGLIRGDKGTHVRLQIRNQKGEDKIVSLKRTELKDEAKLARSALFVKGSEKVGIVYLPDFYDDAADPNGAHAANDVIQHIIQLKTLGMTRLIIDLRNNPGGSLNQVVVLAAALLGDGPKAQLKGKTGIQIMQSNMEPIFGGPLAVLINERSASASEIFAAVIQDYKRGVVIGGPTSYGKGTAQDQWPIGKMGDSSKNIPTISLGSLTLTSFMFYRATGQSTQRSGVVPDILLPSPTAYSSELERDYISALPNVPIPTAQYQFSNTLSAERVADLKQQLRYTSIFQKIDSVAKLIAREDKAPVPLDAKSFLAQQNLRKIRTDQLNSWLTIAKKEQVELLPEDNQTVTAEKWYRDWLNDTQKDIYVAQTCDLLYKL